MKREDRNCNMPYPIYPPYQGLGPMQMQGYQGMMPMQGYQGMMPMQPVPFTANSCSSNNLEQQVNNLSEQVNLLDKRVTALEGNSFNNNNYSSSNYQMM